MSKWRKNRGIKINNMVKKTRSIRRRDSTGVEKNEDKWNYNGKVKRDYRMEGRRV